MSADELIRFTCPCGKRLKTAPDLVGRSIKCPKCGRGIVVVAPEPPTGEPPEKAFRPSAAPPESLARAVAPSPEPRYAETTGDSALTTSRRRQRQTRTRRRLIYGTITCGTILLTLVAVIGIAGFGAQSGSGRGVELPPTEESAKPSPTSALPDSAREWIHAFLFDRAHRKARIVRVDYLPYRGTMRPTFLDEMQAHVREDSNRLIPKVDLRVDGVYLVEFKEPVWAGREIDSETYTRLIFFMRPGGGPLGNPFATLIPTTADWRAEAQSWLTAPEKKK